VYNLICFPHYTCGGLLADILNDTWSEVALNGGISSLHHNLGKIGDSDSTFDSFSQYEFDSIITLILSEKSEIADGSWIGTHCWPGNVSTDKFDQVINITTVTTKSKLYRWLRVYYHHYVRQGNRNILSDLDEIDKVRIGAKKYLIPFDSVNANNVINLEFSDVVENTVRFNNIVKMSTDKHLLRWKQINSFLYDKDLWDSYPAKRFFEAEYEALLDIDYYYY